MKNKAVFIIDIDSRTPEVLLFSGRELEADLEASGVTNPMDLQSYDRRVFETQEEAENWLEIFEFYLDYMQRGQKLLKKAKNPSQKKRISEKINVRFCKSRELPAMLYKRHYMILSLMREKMQTYRNYKKDWQPGQLINLHDQTYFLTVRILSVTHSDKGYCYKFELP